MGVVLDEVEVNIVVPTKVEVPVATEGEDIVDPDPVGVLLDETWDVDETDRLEDEELETPGMESAPGTYLVLS